MCFSCMTALKLMLLHLMQLLTYHHISMTTEYIVNFPMAHMTGKVWKRKDEDKIQINDDVQVETEWDEVLATATEAELVDLAGKS